MSCQKFYCTLNSNDAFRLIYKKGVFLYTPCFYVHHIESEHEIPHIGIVTPKKRFRTAVRRNQLKRYIREAIRLYAHKENMHYKNIILTAHNDILHKKWTDFVASVHKMNQKIAHP